MHRIGALAIQTSASCNARGHCFGCGSHDWHVNQRLQHEYRIHQSVQLFGTLLRFHVELRCDHTNVDALVDPASVSASRAPSRAQVQKGERHPAATLTDISFGSCSRSRRSAGGRSPGHWRFGPNDSLSPGISRLENSHKLPVLEVLPVAH